MNIVNQLTLRYMQKNKSRTRITIAGVIISVAMIAATLSIGVSFMDMMQRSIISYTGNWQAAFQNVDGSKVHTISDAPELKQTSVSHELGFARLPNSQNPNRPYLYITQHSNFDLMAVHVLEGRLPENESELAISSQAFTIGGMAYKVGDSVTLSVGVRESNSQQNEIYDARTSFTSNEVFKETGKQKFVITAIIEAPEQESKAAAGYCALSGLSDAGIIPGQSYSVKVNFKRMDSTIYQVSQKIAEDAENVPDYNTSLLLYTGISDDSRFMTTLVLATLLVGIVILIGSAALIYNAFAISLSERKRALGMMASVGATKQQKQFSVLFEAMVIGIIAIPLGLVIGYAGIALTFKLITPILQNAYAVHAPLKLVIVPASLAGAVIFAAIILLGSAWLPAKKASRITPIDAIRQTQDIEIKSKNIRTSILTRRLFGFEAELGLKNIKRNKQRYLTTVFSLVISIVMFLSASALTLYMKESYKMAQAPIPYDMVVSVEGNDLDQTNRCMNDLMKAQNAGSAISTKTLTAGLKFSDDEISDDIRNRYAKSEGFYAMGLNLVALDDVAYKNYLAAARLDAGKIDGNTPQGILVNRFILKEKHNFTEITQLTATAGKLLAFDVPLSDGKKCHGSIQISAVTNELPPFMLRYEENVTQVYIVVSESTMERIRTMTDAKNDPYLIQNAVQFTAVDAAALEKEIGEIANRYNGIHTFITNSAADRQRELEMAIIVSIFLYGFVALIGIISAANIINTIATGMDLRQREFAMLKTYGITPAGFRRMIRYEGLFYGIKAAAYGLPISFCVIFLLYKMIVRDFDFEFILPWYSILAVLIGVFALIGIAILYSCRKASQQNIVDTLKNENI
ncbi:ABC transporter permease [Lacrimispora defluvii]|uniref:ABC transporter permease n=1 Tax=Lacrimispora defluvii TaxID=2719233 RepID=A0ABX1VTS4_9FIRM|nr:ABC transporter permease [Lacrimispora defluvii]NNJ31788.1 ABC transporter permease [Lacrimispora defluvii]